MNIPLWTRVGVLLYASFMVPAGIWFLVYLLKKHHRQITPNHLRWLTAAVFLLASRLGDRTGFAEDRITKLDTNTIVERKNATPTKLPLNATKALPAVISKVTPEIPRPNLHRIHIYAPKHGVDPILIMAMVRAESTWRENAKSVAGALGLLQMKPNTARPVALKIGYPNFKDEDLFNPAINLDVGCAYVEQLQKKYHTSRAVLLAFKEGEAFADNTLKENPSLDLELIHPPRAQDYIRTVEDREVLLRAKVAAESRPPSSPPVHASQGNGAAAKPAIPARAAPGGAPGQSNNLEIRSGAQDVTDAYMDRVANRSDKRDRPERQFRGIGLSNADSGVPDVWASPISLLNTPSFEELGTAGVPGSLSPRRMLVANAIVTVAHKLRSRYVGVPVFNRDIAEDLGLNVETVKFYRRDLKNEISDVGLQAVEDEMILEAVQRLGPVINGKYFSVTRIAAKAGIDWKTLQIRRGLNPVVEAAVFPLLDPRYAKHLPNEEILPPTRKILPVLEAIRDEDSLDQVTISMVSKLSSVGYITVRLQYATNTIVRKKLDQINESRRQKKVLKDQLNLTGEPHDRNTLHMPMVEVLAPNLAADAEPFAVIQKLKEIIAVEAMGNRTLRRKITSYLDGLWMDPQNLGHLHRVSRMIVILGKALGLDRVRIDKMSFGAFLHDTGKIDVPPEILSKNGKFSSWEWEFAKKHALFGHDLLYSPWSGFLQLAAAMAGGHHAWWNGDPRGYPNLRGREIPFEARIVALADALDGNVSERHYKLAQPFNSVLAEWNAKENGGRHFDPVVFRAMKNVLPQIESVFTTTPSNPRALKAAA